MSEWNEALAVYDEECPDVEAVRAEFEAFLIATFEQARTAVAAEFGEDWRGKLDANAGPQTVWCAQQDQVELSAWYPRAFKNRARGLAAAISLYEPSAFSEAHAKLRRELYLDAAARALDALPGMDPSELHSLELELEPETVRGLVVALGDGSGQAMRKAALALAPLARTLRALHRRTAWLSMTIGSLATTPPRGVAAGVSWESGRLQTWLGGFYVQLQQHQGDHQAWVCARPPGVLLLGHYGDEATAERVRAKLAAPPVVLADEPPAWVTSILDAEAAAAAHAANDATSVQERAMAALAAYYAALA